jgi:hypothetical protein
MNQPMQQVTSQTAPPPLMAAPTTEPAAPQEPLPVRADEDRLDLEENLSRPRWQVFRTNVLLMGLYLLLAILLIAGLWHWWR